MSARALEFVETWVSEKIEEEGISVGGSGFAGEGVGS